VDVAGGTQIGCDDNHDGTSTKTVTTWSGFTVPLTGGPCEWDGSPLAAPTIHTQDIYTCTGSDCATGCTLVSSGMNQRNKPVGQQVDRGMPPAKSQFRPESFDLARQFLGM
jgi:hypothetical protein